MDEQTKRAVQNLRNNVRARRGYNIKKFSEDGIGIPENMNAKVWMAITSPCSTQ